MFCCVTVACVNTLWSNGFSFSVCFQVPELIIFLLLIFDKIPKITQVEDQIISETSTCSDEGDANGLEVNGEIEHQPVLDPQPLTVMKARWRQSPDWN